MGLVIAVAILAVLTAAGVTVYIKVRRLSESLLGTPDVTEGINRIRENVSTTPKSVSGMTRLMEPQIKRDFPEFVWEQFKRMSERVLVSALCAITTEASGEVTVMEADYKHDLTVVPEDMLRLLKDIGVCLSCLNECLMSERIIYGKRK